MWRLCGGAEGVIVASPPQRFKKMIVDEQKDSNELKIYLEECFMVHDPNGTGVLTIEALRQGMKEAELGLTPIKIHSMMAACVMVRDHGVSSLAERHGPRAALKISCPRFCRTTRASSTMRSSRTRRR